MAMARRAEAVPVNANAAERHNGIVGSGPAWLWAVPGRPIRMLVKVVGPAVAAGFCLFRPGPAIPAHLCVQVSSC